VILPPLPHLPGRTPRPPEALFAPLKEGLSAAMDPAALAASPAFREGLRACRAGYYWEAHELWEAVWMCLPPAGAERLILRGVIQLANAGLKRRMGRKAAAARILVLADDALAEGTRRRGLAGLALSRSTIAGLRRQVAGDSAPDHAI